MVLGLVRTDTDKQIERQRKLNQRMTLVGWQASGKDMLFGVRKIGESANRMRMSGFKGEIGEESSAWLTRSQHVRSALFR